MLNDAIHARIYIDNDNHENYDFFHFFFQSRDDDWKFFSKGSIKYLIYFAHNAQKKMVC